MKSIASTTDTTATAADTTLRTVIKRDAVPAPTAQSGDDLTAQSDKVTVRSASGIAPGSQSAMDTAASSSIQPTQRSDDAEHDNLFKVLVTFLARLKPDELDQIFRELENGPSVESQNLHKTTVDARIVSSTTIPCKSGHAYASARYECGTDNRNFTKYRGVSKCSPFAESVDAAYGHRRHLDNYRCGV
ncbi:hypothetical protein QFC21_000034 [Naganishia friedmannii]|uniref:Uncharacterized protein n=1 Tax=Naganishia friedmannii TaxID=89922 RepID=A0ACC2WAC8_9TREE|nr:hypothetical protein QFC21_000034 [Naganishia friedmannii]